MGSKFTNCCKTINVDAIEKEGCKGAQKIYEIQENKCKQKNSKIDHNSQDYDQEKTNVKIVSNENENTYEDSQMLKSTSTRKNSRTRNQNDSKEIKKIRTKSSKKKGVEGKVGNSQSNFLALQEQESVINLSLTNSENQQLSQRLGQKNLATQVRLVRQVEGSIQDCYEMIKKLGEGAFGQVMLSKSKENGEMRAIKSVNKGNSTQQKRLEMEIEILKKIDHPNVVKLYEVFEDSKKIHLVQELVTGGELFDRIIQMQSFNEEDAKQIMKQILQAVQYCHSLNIVHRDLKPENILLQAPHPNNTIKLIDFGTSTLFQSGHKLKEVQGTSYYIAPEVIRGDYDHKCDIWSCGIILFILLCGEPPFNGEDDDEIMKNVSIGEFEFSQKE